MNYQITLTEGTIPKNKTFTATTTIDGLKITYNKVNFILIFLVI
jgi:hypothetical protein